MLFRSKIGKWWLKAEDIEDIAKQLAIDKVPEIATGTLDYMVDFARDGFKSQWGDFEAEGIVARPQVELLRRSGERIITKIKCKDFITEGASDE